MNRRELLTFGLTAAAGVAFTRSRAAQSDLVWHDAAELDIEGRGWSDTESAYDRLPPHAKGSVPDSVWNLSKQSAGIAVSIAVRKRRRVNM